MQMTVRNSQIQRFSVVTPTKVHCISQDRSMQMDLQSPLVRKAGHGNGAHVQALCSSVYDSRSCQPLQLFPPQAYPALKETEVALTDRLTPQRQGYADPNGTELPSPPPKPISLPGTCDQRAAKLSKLCTSKAEPLTRPPSVPHLRLELLQSCHSNKYLRSELLQESGREGSHTGELLEHQPVNIDADKSSDMSVEIEATIGFAMPDGTFQAASFKEVGSGMLQASELNQHEEARAAAPAHSLHDVSGTNPHSHVDDSVMSLAQAKRVWSPGGLVHRKVAGDVMKPMCGEVRRRLNFAPGSDPFSKGSMAMRTGLPV